VERQRERALAHADHQVLLRPGDAEEPRAHDAVGHVLVGLPDRVSPPRARRARADPREPQHARRAHQVRRGSLPHPPDRQGRLSHAPDDGRVLLHQGADDAHRLLQPAAALEALEHRRLHRRPVACVAAASARLHPLPVDVRAPARLPVPHHRAPHVGRLHLVDRVSRRARRRAGVRLSLRAVHATARPAISCAPGMVSADGGADADGVSGAHAARPLHLALVELGDARAHRGSAAAAGRNSVVIVAAHQPHYLPWLGYLAKVAAADLFVVMDDLQYEAQNFQNRNRMKLNHGPQWLTVPLERGPQDERIIDKRIVNRGSPKEHWQRKTWHTLSIHYGSAPFWKLYEPDLEDVYTRPWERLVDLQLHLLR